MTRRAISTAAFAALSALAGPVHAQDRFQWLEAPTDRTALDWARGKSEDAQAKISAMPDHAAIEAELKSALAAGDPPPDFALFGPVALRFQRSTDHPHGILSVAARNERGVPGTWRQVLDVDALRKVEGTPYELRFGGGAIACLAPDYTRCLLSLSPAGGDEVELREFDLTSAAFVDKGFRVAAGRNSAAWMDRDHLLIQHTVGNVPKLSTGWAAATYLWRRDTPLTAAREIYRVDPGDAITTVRAAGAGSERVGIILRAIDYSTIEFRIVRGDGAVERVPLPSKVKLGLDFSAAPRVVVQLGEAATIAGRHYPAETVLAYETGAALPPDRRLSVIHVPQAGEFIADPFAGISIGQSKVRVVLTRRGSSRVVTYARQGEAWKAIASEPEALGTAVALQPSDPAGDDLIIQRAGYLTPTRLDLVHDASAPVTLFAEKPAFDAGRFRVELKVARSKDGTEIDYFLLRPVAPAKPGATPTLMTGYGAFGVSIAPGYLDHAVGGRSLVPWLKRGGALVLPLIRGGGERGEAWHQAAIREKRQNSYDDFAAVTEALIRDGFTSPRHIGVFGSSNGGLLAAVMGTQRPDLYGAIVSDVPLTDLVRMPLMGMGAAWVNEYGDANDAGMRAIIERYSPFQQVKSGVRYPPFMITVATSDNRVGPGHARKLAAKLMEVGSQTYYLEDQEGGHGVSDPLSRPELMADRMTFLIDLLQ